MRQGAKSMIMWYQSVWERYAFWGPLFIIVNNPEYRKKTTKGIAVTANNCAQYSTYIMSPSLPPRKFFSPSPFYSLSFLGVSEFISRGDIYFSYLSIVSSQFLPFKLSFLTLISFVTTVIPCHYFVCFSRSLLHFHYRHYSCPSYILHHESRHKSFRPFQRKWKHLIILQQGT